MADVRGVRGIPKHLIEKHKQGVEALTFYGVPVTELDRDGLLAFANVCAQELTNMRKRFLGFIETSRALREATRIGGR